MTMQKNPKPKPEPKGFKPNPSQSAWTSLHLVLAYSGVLIPLGWGIFKTLQKAAILMRI
ncbi:MAG: MFS transporter small subunit [Methylococcaceae bacterium]